MNEPTLIARRTAARLLIGPLAGLCVSLPGRASGVMSDDDQEKVAAANVAKKLEKAKKTREEKKESAALRHFEEELTEYAQFHDRAVKNIGTIESEAAQKALAAAILARRRKARQGDILLPEIQPHFRKLIEEQLKGPDTKAAQKAVVEGNPGHDEDSPKVAVKVNAPYPRGAARSTIPASVLLTLPPLPPCLNYLFVGRTLILIDVAAQVIVDFLPTAAPELIQ